MIGTLLDRIDSFRAMRVRHTSPYWGAMADLPPTLYPYWKQTAHVEFKGIPRDAFFFARAAEGLLTFFECVLQSERQCGLPSMAADSVWHAWRRLAPASLDAFCLRHFGRLMPHVEAIDMTVPMEDALANCLVQARKLEGLPVAVMSVPRLFALDRELRMPNGFGYRQTGALLGCQRLDQAGRSTGVMHYPARFAPVGLLAAGLISQAQYDDYVHRARTTDGGGDAPVSEDSACDGGDGGCGGGCGGD